MEDQKPTEIDTNTFIKKHLNGFLPTSVAVIILYLTFQIMAQLSTLQKQIAELRSSILTRDIVHQISRQECEKFYRIITSDIQERAYKKILEYHQNQHK